MDHATVEACGGGARAAWAWFLAIIVLLLLAAVADRWLIEALVTGQAPQIDPRIYHCAALGHEQGLDPYRAVYPPGCFEGHFRFVYPPALLELFAWLRPGSLAATTALRVASYSVAFVLLAWGLARLLWPGLAWPAVLIATLLANPETLLSWAYFGNIAVLLYGLLLAGVLAFRCSPARGAAALAAAVVVAACFKWILVLYLLPLVFAAGRRGLRWALAALLLLALLYGLDAWRAPEQFRAYLEAFDSHRQHVDLGMGIPTFGFDLLEAFAGARDLSDRAEWFGRGIWAVLAGGMLLLAWRVLGRLAWHQRLVLGLVLAGLLLPRVKTYDWTLLLPALVHLITATRPARAAWPRTALGAARFLAVAALLLLPFQTAFYGMVFGTLAWLLALERDWIRVQEPDPAAVVPPPLRRWLLRERTAGR